MSELIKNFYEKIYLKENGFNGWSKTRGLKALSFIPKNSKVLNLGCGVGIESKLFKRKGCFVSGCDISENALRKAVSCQNETKFVDLHEVPYPYSNKSFNVVYSSEVVEHLIFIEPFLKECHRILRDDGKLILTTNNPAYLKNRIRLLFGSSDWTSQQGHLHYYTPSKLKEFLSEVGFRVEYCRNIGNFFFASLGDCFLVVAVKK